MIISRCACLGDTYGGVEVQHYSFLTCSLDGLSGHLHTLQNLCVNKESLGHIHHEAGCSPEPVLMSTEQR